MWCLTWAAGPGSSTWMVSAQSTGPPPVPQGSPCPGSRPHERRQGPNPRSSSSTTGRGSLCNCPRPPGARRSTMVAGGTGRRPRTNQPRTHVGRGRSGRDQMRVAEACESSDTTACSNTSAIAGDGWRSSLKRKHAPSAMPGSVMSISSGPWPRQRVGGVAGIHGGRTDARTDPRRAGLESHLERRAGITEPPVQRRSETCAGASPSQGIRRARGRGHDGTHPGSDPGNAEHPPRRDADPPVGQSLHAPRRGTTRSSSRHGSLIAPLTEAEARPKP